MTSLSRKAAAVLIAGAASLAVLTPAAMAEDRGPGRADHQRQHAQSAERFLAFRAERGGHHLRGPGGPRGGMLNVTCSDRGAEGIEHAFVSLSYRVDLTDEQKPAFDDLKATALGAQADFAETCSAAVDAVRANGDADMLQRMQTRLAIETARIEAMETLLPKFETFYNGLSDEQKASLQPRQHEGRERGDRGPRRPGHERPGAERPAAPPAPENPADLEDAPSEG